MLKTMLATTVSAYPPTPNQSYIVPAAKAAYAQISLCNRGSSSAKLELRTGVYGVSATATEQINLLPAGTLGNSAKIVKTLATGEFVSANLLSGVDGDVTINIQGDEFTA